jgi:peptidyl-prolyl cis-trans isomerase D
MAREGTVVEAWEHKLTVDELASFLAQQPNLPLSRKFVERFAHRWMEYSLFAQHVATGDSLLDSATVVEANWLYMYQSISYQHYRRMMEERTGLDSAAVDSAYYAGEPRIVQHILIRKRQDMTPAEVSVARRRAERVRARLSEGASWARMNEQFNDDVAARKQGGSIGVLWRGTTVPEFDSVAFALAPGELSQVVETIFGFHIVRRPTLAEVWEEFRTEIESYVMRQMDSVYLARLEERRKVRVRSDAAALARAIEQVLRTDPSALVARAREAAATKFSVDRQVRRMSEIYHHVMSQR